MTDAYDRLRTLDAVAYADVFDCAVTLDEVKRYSRKEVSPRELQGTIDEFVERGLLHVTDGYVHLPGREELARARPAHRARANRLRGRAQNVARCLRHLPFVRGIHLTGSVAADHAAADADVDFLIVVRDGRLGLAFLQFGILARLLSRQVCCPNYYLSESALEIPQHSVYVAREIAQATPLAGSGDLLDSNPWVLSFFPNARHARAAARMPARSRCQGILESLLAGRRGDWLEDRARRLTGRRLEAHYAGRHRPLPRDVREAFRRGESLRFHASPVADGAEAAYERRVRALEAALEQLAS